MTFKYLDKIAEKFKRKKKQPIQTWGGQAKPMYIIKKPKVHRKIRIPGLNITKRVGAGILFILYLIMAIGGLNSAAGILPGIIFFVTMFYLLDYLHKSKKTKIDWEEQK